MKITAKDVYQLFQIIETKRLSISEAIMLLSYHSSATTKSKSIKEIISLTVDYGRNLEQMIEVGEYDHVNVNITEQNFSLATELRGQKTSVTSQLIHFGCDISSEDAMLAINKIGHPLATLPELLALGEAYPDLQFQFPIIAFGSIWHDASGRLRVPYLVVDGTRRKLELYWFDYGWHANCRFLVICK